MQQVIFSDQTHWQFESLQKYAQIKHLITGSNLHIKRGDIAGLNYGLNVPDQERIIIQNRNELVVHLELGKTRTVFPIQTHSSNIEIITEQNKHQTIDGVDALITNIPNILIGVLSADCVPILLFDPSQQVIAAIHAGWKGTASEIVKHTLLKMKRQFNCQAKNIIAAIGPSISSEKFEVGEEVANQLRDASKTPLINGKCNIDLWLENKTQLMEVGVLEKNIEMSEQCTFLNTANFYSARRDGFNTGRLASVITLLT